MSKASFQLKVGSVFECDGINHFVVEINRAVDQIVLRNSQSDSIYTLGIQSLYEAVKAGAFTPLNLHGETTDTNLKIHQDGSLTDQSKKDFELRKTAVKKADALIAKGLPAMSAYALVARELSESKEVTRIVSARSVRRWCDAHRKNGLKALVPQHDKKGRTKSQMVRLVEELIRKVVYEVSGLSRLCLKNICELVQNRMPEIGMTYKDVTYARVRDVVLHLPWAIRHVSKFEPKLQRSIASFGVEKYQVDYPFSRVEMDCCKLPFFALYKNGGKAVEVWAVVAIDIATGHILSAHLTMRPPNAVDTLSAVQQASHGLTDAEFDAAEIGNRIKLCGGIEELVVDNGSEFRNNAFANVTKLGISVTYCPSYSPYRKPFVERAIGALKSFVGALPGSTVNRANPSVPETARGEKDAVIPINKLQQMVNRFIFDDYAVRKMHRHEIVMALLGDKWGLSPSDRIKNFLKQFTPSPPQSSESFRLARMTEQSATLQKYGIRHDTLEYSSPELKSLYGEIGISTKSLVVPDKLNFLFDPLDIRTILVIHPITKKTFPAFNKIELDFAMSAEQFKESRERVEATYNAVNAQTIQHDFKAKLAESLSELEAEAKKQKKRANRKDSTKVAKAKTSVAQPALKEKLVVPASQALPSPEVTGARPLDVSAIKPAKRLKRGGA